MGVILRKAKIYMFRENLRDEELRNIGTKKTYNLRNTNCELSKNKAEIQKTRGKVSNIYVKKFEYER